MDEATVLFNVGALLVSVGALAVSVFVGLRQLRLSDGGNQLPVVLEAFRESRGAGWLPAHEYALEVLAAEHSPDLGYSGLPDDARAHLNTICIFYDDLGKLVAHRVIDKNLVIGAYGKAIVRLWDAVAPFVYAERRQYWPHFWVYFEHLAVLTARADMNRVYRGLRTRPPEPLGH